VFILLQSSLIEFLQLSLSLQANISDPFAVNEMPETSPSEHSGMRAEKLPTSEKTAILVDFCRFLPRI
jgi:hypothetical protein